MFVGELLSLCVKIRGNRNFGKICQHSCWKNPNFRFFWGGAGGEGVGEVVPVDQFYLSTRSINKML